MVTCKLFKNSKKNLKETRIYTCVPNIVVTESFVGKLSVVTKIFCILNHFGPFSDLFTPTANNTISQLCSIFKIIGCFVA